MKKKHAMRWSLALAVMALASALALTIAARTPRDQTYFFNKSVWRTALDCSPLLPPIGGNMITDLTPVSDTTFAALYSDERELTIYDRAFKPLHSLRFDKDGPRGVRAPVSAAVSNRVIYVADQGTGSIKLFTFGGHNVGTVKLDFIPRQVRAGAGRLLVTPLVAGTSPSQLLYEIIGDKVSPLGAPIARYDDLGVNTLANMVSIAAFKDRAVVMHELVVPFGYSFGTRPSPILRRFAIPLSVDVKHRIKHLPRPPLTEENVNELTIVAFAVAAAGESGKTFYVTRIGDGKRHEYRKLLVELDANLQLSAVYPIAANPHYMVYMSKPAAIVSVDADYNWTECRLP